MFAWSALRTSVFPGFNPQNRFHVSSLHLYCCQDLRATVHQLLLNETLSFLRETLTVSRKSRNRTESGVCS